MKPLVAAAVIAIAFAQPLFAQPDLREALDAAKVIAKQAQADAHRRVYDEGRILVVETDDGDSGSGPIRRASFIDGATVITASKEKKEQFAMLLKASVVTRGVPMRMAVLSLDVASVSTLDEYIGNLESGYQRNKAEYERANPGKTYPGASSYIPETRKELEQQLQGHDAVVLRYIHIKRSGEK